MTGDGIAYLPALGIVNALGQGVEQVRDNLFSGSMNGMVRRTDILVDGSPVFVGGVTADLPEIPERLSAYASRNFQLVIAAMEQIRPAFDLAVKRHGLDRVAVVMGTSTSGIAEGEAAVRAAEESNSLPADFDVRAQEPGSVGEALARYLGVGGLAYTVSTACSSGSLAIVCGRRLLHAGLADVVLAGGADSLCRLTVNGFHALSALSAGHCNPMSRNRDGICIGEGAAIFLMQREESGIALLGAGATSDAHSMTAPEPDGGKVEDAIRMALADAALSSGDIDYIQLHGTGTEQNDVMESKVIKRVFDDLTPCSSSKRQLGHTLGAAGAMGAANCWLAAAAGNESGTLPPHIWDGEAEPGLLAENLVAMGQRVDPSSRRIFLTNAFAFGGSNSALIVGRTG